ncbi:MAG: phosphotransferase enzyme family protein [Cyanobium sp.]
MTLSAVDPQLAAIAASFAGAGAVASVRPLGNGNINATYVVLSEAGESFVLQRLNGKVFPQPERVMGNLLAIGEHVERRLGIEEPIGARRRWVVPKVRSTVSGQPWLEAHGAVWRAISYVPDTISREALQTPAQAREVGYGLGRFHELLHDLPCERLADTLPGFHITPGYLAQYEAICAAAPRRSGAEAEREAWAHRFIAERQGWAAVLERAKAAGELPERPIHVDPKVNNMLRDACSACCRTLIAPA